MVKGNLKIENISKVFKKKYNESFIALNNVDLDIKAGSIVSFIGPSGCGKTTLLRLIAGLEEESSGSIYLDNKKIKSTSYERGLVFQDAKLFPWLNIYDNVSFGLRARGIYKENKEEVDKYLEIVGLKDFKKNYPHELSGGMKQRASLSRAMINKPSVLLLDEPLGALDALTRMKMQDELIDLWKSTNLTMVMVTHDVEEAIYLSDHIVVMTPRPAKVEKEIDINLKRPRDRNSREFIALKNEILEIMNFKNLNI